MDPFYELYKDAGLIDIEVGTNGVVALVCFAGIFLNFSLVYVTIKTKSLHGTCNILIALYAFFISLHLIGYSTKFFVFLFGINYITLKICFFIQFIPIFCTNFGINLQLCIGIDRLFAILRPIWYKSGGKFLTFKLLISLNLVMSVIGTYISYHGASLHWDKPVMCSFIDAVRQPETLYFSMYRPFTIYCIEFLCYVLIWAIIFCKKSSQLSSKHKRLMFSLSILMSIGIFYLFILTVFNNIVPRLNLDIFTNEYVVTPIIFTVYMVANGATTPVLLLCSKEYSGAFRECFRRSNAVTSVAQVQIIR